MKWSALLGMGLVACAASAPKYSFKLPDLQTRLPNGMRVILLPDSSTDLVEVDVRYEVGSREDPEGKAGLAHLVEHLMFQQRQAGPDKPPIGVVIGGAAVGLNAFTNWDSTHYVTLAPAASLEKIVALEAARLHTGCDTIDEETFQREREVVRNEIRLREGAPEAEVDRLVLEAVYPSGHAYRRTIGGDDKQLTSITLADVCAFMKDHYVPERATLIIAGAVSKDAGARLAATYLAPLAARKPAPRRVVAPVKPESRTVEVELPVEETTVVAVWPMPPTYSEDGALARFGLNQLVGRTAFAGVTYEFATEIGATILGGSDAPVFAVYVSLVDSGKIGEAKGALKRAAAAAQRKIELTKEEMKQLRALLTGQTVVGMEILPARTVRFAEWAQFRPDGGFLAGELDRIRKLDDDAISRVVKRVLDPDKATFVVVRAGKDRKATYRRAALRYAAAGDVLSERDQLPVDRTEAARALPVSAHVSRMGAATSFTLDNGMRVVLVKLDGAVPTATVALEFGVGTAHEPADRKGLARIAAHHLAPSPPFALDEVGATWDGDVGADSTRFVARGLSLYLPLLVEGLERLVTVGDYSQRSIEDAQRRARLTARRVSAAAEERLELAFAGALFPSHPYGRIETAATLGNVGRDAAMAWKRKHFSARNATLVVVGTFELGEAESLVRRIFGGWGGGHRDEGAGAVSLARNGPTYIAVEGDPALPTIRLLMGFPTPAGVDDKHAARLVLAAMLQERVRTVREKLGASYGIFAGAAHRVGPGTVMIGGPVDAERAGEALAALRNGLAALRQGEHFVEDFVRARRTVLQRLVADSTGTQELATRALFALRHGQKLAFDEELVQRVARLTPREVMAVLAEVRPDGEVVALMGPRALVDKAYKDAGITQVIWK